MDNLNTNIIATGIDDTAILGKEFCVGKVSSHSAISHPFIMCDYGCVICMSGEASGSIDMIPYIIRPSMMVVHVPGQLIVHQGISDDFEAIFVSMTSAFVIGLGLPYSFQIDTLVRDNPVLHLQPQHMEAMISYCKMAKALLNADHPYQRETLRHLTCAFFYGIGRYLYQMSGNTSMSNEEDITWRFMKELKANYRHERKVRFYADRLNISAGYLSTVIRNVSGKTPTELIEEYVVKEACAQLKSTSRTVQQISNDLNFASQSFFGKYFKRVMGCSPLAYRENG
ncbi:MAG: helix-turn-helix domain-containing protein [Muribaculaceae bacterium]